MIIMELLFNILQCTCIQGNKYVVVHLTQSGFVLNERDHQQFYTNCSPCIMVHVSDGNVLVEAKDLTAHLNLQREYYYNTVAALLNEDWRS